MKSENRIHVWVQAFKDRPALMLQWIDPETGARKSKSTGTSDADKAEQMRSDFEYELNNGLHAEPSKITWEHFRDLFMKEYAAGLRDRSQEKFETVFDVFEQEMKPGKMSAINERVISRFVQALRLRERPGGKIGLAPITIRNYLVNMQTALAWAKDQGFIQAVPKMVKIKVPKKKPQPIPAEDFDKLLAAAPDDLWRAFMLCGWWAGLRLSEVYELRWAPTDKLPWIDWAGDRIALPAVFAKSDEDQWVPIHPQLRTILEAIPRTAERVFPFLSRRGGGPLTRNGLTNRILDMAAKAGVKLSMHKLRKGFGCRVAKQLGKGNAPILHRLMRHSTMQITMDYYASVDDALQDAIGQLA